MSGKLTGKVAEVDESGNLVTDISLASLGDAPRDTSLRIVVDEHETYGVFPEDHDQPAMTLVAVADESGPIRIVLVGDSASGMLGVQVGADVHVSW